MWRFFQLPPVLGSDPEETELLRTYYGGDIGNGYAFQGKMWDTCGFYTVFLDEVVRQKDVVFAENLNRLRVRDLTCLDYLNVAAGRVPEHEMMGIYALNDMVDRENERRLAGLEGDPHTFLTQFTPALGNLKTEREALSYVPRRLVLKEGARVIFTSNDHSSSRQVTDHSWPKAQGPLFVNGMGGTVVSMGSFDVSESEPEPIMVKTDAGKLIEVGPVTKHHYGYFVEDGVPVRKRVASYTNLPLRLAYAVTIHKAQGETYDSAIICPAYAQNPGQLYVAASRVRDRAGLYLTRPISSKDVHVSEAVSKFYKGLGDGGFAPKKKGRPSIHDEKRDRYLWVPVPLADHVREELRQDRIISLRSTPAYYSANRIHMRVPDHLKEGLKAQIDSWKGMVSPS